MKTAHMSLTIFDVSTQKAEIASGQTPKSLDKSCGTASRRELHIQGSTVQVNIKESLTLSGQRIPWKISSQTEV